MSVDESPPVDGAVFAAGTPVGRYQIVSSVAGPRAIVCEALDPELHRQVSIKVLHAGSATEAGFAERLRRATAALAALSHPHVIAVHDTGVIGDRSFVVFEHLDGGTLAEWLAARTRRPGEIVARFRQAGAGLAAAHAGGLTHGAFTAASVRLGRDGRLQVDLLEVDDGEGDDRRAADQRAFCAALAAALPAVPRWLRPILARGRAAGSPSMKALLAEIDWVPRRRRRVALAAAGVVAAGLGAAAIALGGPTAPVCRDGAARLAAVWSPAQRAIVERAFTASDRPFAADAWRSVSSQLDAWRAGFVATHDDACRATRVQHQQPEPILDRRMACLDRAAHDAAALVDLLAAGDRDAIQRGAEAVAGLASPAGCDGRGPDDPPSIPPGQEAAVEALHTAIAGLRAQLALHRYTEVAAGADALIATAERTGFLPALAELRTIQGSSRYNLSRPDALEALDEALIAAVRAHRDDLIADIHDWASRVLAIADRPDEALARARLADAIYTRLGAGPRRMIDVQLSRAAVHTEAGRLDAALAADDEALAMAVRLDDPEALRLAHGAHAQALANVGRFDDAEAEYLALIDELAAVRGAMHPDVAEQLDSYARLLLKRIGHGDPEAVIRRALAIHAANDPGGTEAAMTRINLALVMLNAGRVAEARHEVELAVPIIERNAGPSSSTAIDARAHYVMVLAAEGDWGAAATAQATLVERRRALVGPDHPLLGQDLAWLCGYRGQAGSYPEAIAAGDQALRLLAPLGDHPIVATAEGFRGYALLAAGRLADAEAAYAHAIAILDETVGDGNRLAETLTGLGRVRIAQHRPGDAVPLIERAVAMYERVGGSPADLAATRAALAEAHAAGHRR